MLNLIKSLTRPQKRAIMILLDAMLIALALWIAFHLQLPKTLANANMLAYVPALPYLLVLSAGLSLWLGIASVPLNQYEGGAIGLSAVHAFFLAGGAYVLAQGTEARDALSLYIVFGACFFVLSAIARAVSLRLLIAIYRMGEARCRVLIYGAGTTGLQLVSAFRSHRQIDPVAFVDDNAALQGMNVAGLPVFSPVRIAEIVAERKIDRVLLAMPSQSQPKQAQIARRLQAMGLEVQTLPSFSQLIGEEALVDKLQPMNPTSFLNRAEVKDALGKGVLAYRDHNILISGAGGSIGAELCRQVLECRPRRLVLFELSELALYTIHAELTQLLEGAGTEIVPILGSVTDARQVRKVLRDQQVQVILHAAAYKHVPLVETNPLAGLANNVLGTHTLAEEAARQGIERFILVSSDKAVRPTNVMGASKRLAELVVQDLASRVPEGDVPKYAIVRFGNVLGSSGSVVPLFQEQLRRGGPLTVTHPDVSRYFMTVQEAVKLVLQAGAMATGGEVYVLDMGKPMRIDQLARQVIESAGYSVRDSKHPEGDIEIVYTGLRPGEKMTEELTLSGTLIGTQEPKILYAQEKALSEIEVASALRALRQALATGDEDAARAVAQRWVEDFGRAKARNQAASEREARFGPVT